MGKSMFLGALAAVAGFAAIAAADVDPIVIKVCLLDLSCAFRRSD